ncbi:MAG: bifunctional ADP-heptose synthase [Anaerolineae bacterium]
MTASLRQAVDRLKGQRVLIVGDVILDEYLIGNAERLSREAPIPVLTFERRELIPGGAANPGVNVARLESNAVQIGVIGDDENGTLLLHQLRDGHIDPAGLVRDPSRPTTTKTRIMAQMGLRFPQQVVRLDRLDRSPISPEIERQVCQRIRELARDANAVIASDYLGGLMTPTVVAAIKESQALKVADAQGQFLKYVGFDLVKCNAAEAARYVRRDLHDDADFESAGREISVALGGGDIMITRGAEGMSIIHGSEVTHVAAPTVEDVFDTVGAGDTVVALMTLALCAKLPLVEAALIANAAAGIVIRKVGNYAPTPDELREALS